MRPFLRCVTPACRTPKSRTLSASPRITSARCFGAPKQHSKRSTAMIHLDEGTLRRYCDEEDALDPVQRAHVDTCPECGALLSEIRADAAFAAAAMSPDSSEAQRTSAPLEISRAWSRVRG